MAKEVDIPLHLYQVLEEEYLNLHGPLAEEDTVELPTTLAGAKTYRRVIARRDWLFHRGHIKRPLSLVLKLLSREERMRLGAAANGSANGAPADPARPGAALQPAGAETAPPERPARNTLPQCLRGPLAFEDLKRIHEALTPFAGRLDSLIDKVKVPELPPLPEGRGETAEEAAERRALEEEREEALKRRAAQEALDGLRARLNALLLDEGEQLYTAERFMHVALAEATKLLIQEGTTHVSGNITEDVKSLFAERVLFTGDDLVQFKRLLLEDAFPDEIEPISNVRLAAINGYLHREGQAALCLSGGGIRSGTFALGLIQGLARRNLLGGFQYLSTVSGGGYIGSWLTAWIHRHRDGLEGVTNDLRNTPPDTKVDPDPGPVRYLRRYSNFITPQVGLLTADTWTFVAIYLRNLFLNWAVLVPLLLGWLLLPRVYNSILLSRTPPAEGGSHHELGWDLAGYRLEGRHLLLALGCLLAVMAISYVAFNRPYIRELLRVRSPFWFRRTGQRSFLRWCLLPLTGAAVCVTIYWGWSREVHEALRDPDRGPWPYLVFGAGLCVTGWLAAMCVLRRLPWAAPVLAALLGFIYLSRNIDSPWRFALLALFVLFALVEWLLVRRARLVYARPGELSLFEAASLTLAGVVGGFFFWLGEYRIASPVQRTITADWLTWTTEFYTCLAVPVFFAGFLLAMTMFIGLTSHSQKFTDEDREWWARAGAWCLIVCIGWVVFGALVIFGPLALLYAPKILGAAGGASGLLSLVAGRSSKTPANEEKAAEGGLLSTLMGSLLPLLAALFLAIFVALLALVTSLIVIGICRAYEYGGWVVIAGRVPELADADILQPLGHMWAVHYASYLLAVALAAALLAFGFVMARAINLNRFSLHAGYRDRLIRGFLGASRDEGARRPNPFTGFDPLDNVRMHELQPMLMQEGDFLDIGRLADRLRLADPAWREGIKDDVSQYLWDKGVLRDDTKEELQDYSPDALPSQSLKELVIRDLNAAVEDLEYPLYAAEPFLPLRQQEPASGVIKWVRAKTADELEQYRRSPYAILLNRVLLQLAYPNEIRKKYPPPHRAMHIVNTTLNLVGGDNLAWQQRKAEPFSVSPLHSGCFRLGYRRSRFYGDSEGIKLGTAMAISGAAASSNMGYYTTSPVLSMVLTLFNVRLGWWLGNPGPAGQATYRRQSPKYSVAPILAEAFGLTDDKSKYVYLTDGGHFENLALYEMVLRRCRLIILSDAAADEEYQFNDLGNAVRKIRIDLGVPIDFEEMPIFRAPLHGGKADGEGARRGGYWAVGRIRYSCVDKGAEDGLLVYVKPAVYGHEPQDVLHYKRSHKSFPHETTADQFFDEPQFESYRALGSYILDRMCGDDDSQVETVEALARRVYGQVESAEKWKWPEVEAPWLTPPQPQQKQDPRPLP